NNSPSANTKTRSIESTSWDGAPDSRSLPEESEELVVAEDEVGELVTKVTCVLDERPQPPPGFADTGSELTFRNTAPEWRQWPALPQDAAGPTLLLTEDERLLFAIAGGTLFRYSQELRAWDIVMPLPRPRSDFAAIVHKGRIHVVGGIQE